MRMRKKKNLVPRMERCGACHVKDGFSLKGHWRETLMPAAREVRVELGCGKGRFTAETARQNPEILFIAIEKVPDAMVVGMERCCTCASASLAFSCPDSIAFLYLFRSLYFCTALSASPRFLLFSTYLL